MKKSLLVASGIILLCIGCTRPTVPTSPVVTEPAAAKPIYTNITKGPFLLRVYQTKAAVMWETDVNGPQQLFYGSDNPLEHSIASPAEKIEYQIAGGLPLLATKTVFIHKVWLENLKAGQTYNYLIGNTVLQNRSFRTPAADSNEIAFAVYGDSRTGAENHKKIVSQIIKQNPAFVVHTGDLVTSGNIYEQFGSQFFEPIKDLAESVPVYVIKGNHDGKSGYFERLFIPPGEKNNFGVNFGPVYYYFADNYSEDLSTDELLKQIAANVHAAKAEWKFVSFHNPALNFSGHNSKWGYPNALPMFAKAGADFVVCGHSHMYERFKPVAPPIHSGANFVTYITTGGGGAPLTKNPNHSNFYASASSVYHFCVFHIKGDNLTMDVIDIDGNVIDHLEITKTGGKLNGEYLQTSMPMAEVLAEQRVRKESIMQ